ncbi:glycosyltransferase family 2 protein [Paenibacillus sp. CAU 1782]
MDTTVVIPNYNGEKYIEICIDKALLQIEDESKIIVIDNNSNDNSVKIIKKKYQDIIVVVNDKNMGFSYAVNQGIKLSKTKYVLLLNNDAFILPDFILNMEKCIESDPLIFSVSSLMLNHENRDIVDNAGDQLTLLGWAFKTGDGDTKYNYMHQRVVFSSCAGAALYRVSTFDVIGYFDETFFAYLEDVDIGFRANIKGFKNVFCPTAEVLHIGSATSGGEKYNHFKVNISARNNVLLLYKNLPLLFLLVLLPIFLLGIIIKMMFFLRKGYLKSYLNGFFAGIRLLPEADNRPMKKRELIYYCKIVKMMFISSFNYVMSFIKKVSRK